MKYVVDMQGFLQPSSDYLLKELAIIQLPENISKQEEKEYKNHPAPLVFLFKKPFAWDTLTDECKSKNLWLTQQHGLAWNSGNIKYREIKEVLKECLSNATTVYVSGSTRKEWLERFHFRVRDIDDLGYNPSKVHRKIVTICTNHKQNYKITCALRNAQLMRQFYLQNIYTDGSTLETQLKKLSINSE